MNVVDIGKSIKTNKHERTKRKRNKKKRKRLTKRTTIDVIVGRADGLVILPSTGSRGVGGRLASNVRARNDCRARRANAFRETV